MYLIGNNFLQRTRESSNLVVKYQGMFSVVRPSNLQTKLKMMDKSYRYKGKQEWEVLMRKENECSVPSEKLRQSDKWESLEELQVVQHGRNAKSKTYGWPYR